MSNAQKVADLLGNPRTEEERQRCLALELMLNEFDSFRSQLSDKDAEIDRLKSTLTIRDEALAHCGNERMVGEREIKKLRDALSAKARAVLELQSKYEDALHRLNSRDEECDRLECGEIASANRNAALRSQLAELQAKHDALIVDNEKTSSALRQATRWAGECENLRAQLAQQKKLTAGQQKAAGKIGREFDLLQKDWLKAIEERDELKTKLANIKTNGRCVYCDASMPLTEMAKHVMACDKRTPDQATRIFVKAFAMRDEAQALLAQAERLTLSAPGWLPIESAPRDGTDVLVFDTALGTQAAHFRRGEWHALLGQKLKPTHWQQLPAPPQKS